VGARRILERELAESITGAIRPASRSGQTSVASDAAIRALARSDCGRSVDPVIVRRRIMTSAKLISTFGPSRKAIWTSRPSSFSARTLRGR
jgi:hypothetical protein